MPQICTTVEALLEDLIDTLEDLKSATHQFSDLAGDSEDDRVMVLAWKHSLQAQRDLIRGEIQRRQNG